MSLAMNEWLEEGIYLPECMRDFHDAKKLFKRIQWLVESAKEDKEDMKKIYAKQIQDWQLNHIYVIDFFLWFMAKRGYTLQKSRMKFDFIDLNHSLSELQEQEANMLKDMMNASNQNSKGSPSENSFNKDLTATQQVASPKCPSDTSLNPDIKRNFGFCSKAVRN